MTEPDLASRCGICGLDAAPVLLQQCFRCSTRFHLNPTNRAGIDCGDAVLGSVPGMEFGVEYYCTPCIGALNDEIVEATAAQARLDAVERRPGWRA